MNTNIEEILSVASSSSDLSQLEIPHDIPDGPAFHDLAQHIDQVTKNVIHQQHHHVDINPSAIDGWMDISNSISITDIDHGLPILEDSEKETEANTSALDVNRTDGNMYSSVVDADLDSEQNEEGLDTISTLQMNEISDNNFEQFAQFPEFPNTDQISKDWAQTSCYTNSDIDTHDSPNFSNLSINSELDNSVLKAPVNFEYEVNIAADESDDEDFGEFTTSVTAHNTENLSTSIDSAAKIETDHIECIGILERLLSHLEPALARAFQSSDCAQWIKTMEMDPVVPHPETDIHLMEKRKEPCLWDRLISPNRLPDYRYLGVKSPIYAACARAVNVDTRKMMPAFARELRLLKPTRLDAGQTSNSSDGTSVAAEELKSIETSDIHLPAPIIPGASSKKVEEASTLPDARSATHQTPEFDWTSSGLVNPLANDPTPGQPAQLDLDFFEMQPASMNPTKPNTAELERDVLGGMSLTTDSPLRTAAPITQETDHVQPTKWSQNVRAALSRLPRLTYMRARNLNFPVADPKTS